MAQRRVRVRGIRRDEIDVDKLAIAYFLMAKAEVARKREREAAVRERPPRSEEVRRER